MRPIKSLSKFVKAHGVLTAFFVGCTILFCGATIAASLHEGGEAEDEAFHVIDTSLPWVMGTASWLDENTVVFVGFPGEETWENGHPPPRRLYIWRIGGKTEQLPTGEDKVLGACANDGDPAYTLERDKHRYLTTIAGNVRTEVPAPEPTNADQANFAGPTLCRPHRDERMQDTRWVPNWSGTRYLDFGSRAPDFDGTRPSTIVFESSAGEQRRTLTAIDTAVSYVHVQTPEWDDSFVLWDTWGLGSPRGDTLPYVPIYRVDASGSVKVSHLANGRPLRSSAFITYRDGYLVATTGAGEPDHAGLFLLGETTIKRVLKGYMIEPSVSPSGCRLAVADSMDAHGRALFMERLKIIDLCGDAAAKH